MRPTVVQASDFARNGAVHAAIADSTVVFKDGHIDGELKKDTYYTLINLETNGKLGTAKFLDMNEEGFVFENSDLIPYSMFPGGIGFTQAKITEPEWMLQKLKERGQNPYGIKLRIQTTATHGLAGPMPVTIYSDKEVGYVWKFVNGNWVRMSEKEAFGATS